MKNRKGFTLIELLAVIIILAVIALIATPVVLNIVENSKRQANKNSVYGLLDGAKLYYAESLLETSKQSNINGTTNLINEIKVSGDRPDSGVVYINSKGETALAVVYDNVCYTKNFTENELIESEDISNCTLGVEETPIVPEVSYKCKRADVTTLHTEECTQTSNAYYCSEAGYTGDNTTITYGNKKVTPGVLTSGDAFDCDVNGDEIYDPVTERFYYVSDLSSNTEYAVLIYYNNTTAGIADNSSSSLVHYNSNNRNYEGPVTAIVNLPTEEQWSNVSLSSTSRAITNENGGTTTSSGSYTLPTAFSYTKTIDGEIVPLAARLLTFQEVATACGGDGRPTSTGELDVCIYLAENTKYSNSSLGTSGYWLETPQAELYSDRVWFVSGEFRLVKIDSAKDMNYASRVGLRPAIEVLKTDIEF